MTKAGGGIAKQADRATLTGGAADEGTTRQYIATAADYEVDETRRLLITRVCGVVTDHDLFDLRRRILDDSRVGRDFCQLADYRGVTSAAVTSQGIRQLAKDGLLGPGARRAFVTDRDSVLGLLRMFQILAEGRQENIQLFRTIEDAVAWLGLDRAGQGEPGTETE